MLTKTLVIVVTLLITLSHSSTFAQESINFEKVELETTKISDGIYVLSGPGVSNVLVFAGSDGVLLFDSGYSQLFAKINEAVRKITDKPIRYVVNSHFHADHTGGNEELAKRGGDSHSAREHQKASE